MADKKTKNKHTVRPKDDPIWLKSSTTLVGFFPPQQLLKLWIKSKAQLNPGLKTRWIYGLLEAETNAGLSCRTSEVNSSLWMSIKGFCWRYWWGLWTFTASLLDDWWPKEIQTNVSIRAVAAHLELKSLFRNKANNDEFKGDKYHALLHSLWSVTVIMPLCLLLTFPA